MPYDIIKGIAIAPNKYAHNKYPFAKMQVGECFQADNSSYEEIQRIRTAINAWQRNHPPMKFALRKDHPSGNYFCHRIN